MSSETLFTTEYCPGGGGGGGGMTLFTLTMSQNTWLHVWQTFVALDMTNTISRNLIYALNHLVVCRQTRQISSRGNLSLNLYEH